MAEEMTGREQASENNRNSADPQRADSSMKTDSASGMAVQHDVCGKRKRNFFLRTLRRKLTSAKTKNGILKRMKSFCSKSRFIAAAPEAVIKVPGKCMPSEPHLDLRQTAWYVLPQTGIMGGRHGT